MPSSVRSQNAPANQTRIMEHGGNGRRLYRPFPMITFKHNTIKTKCSLKTMFCRIKENFQFGKDSSFMLENLHIGYPY